MDEQTNNTLLFNHNLQKQKIAEAQAKKLGLPIPGVVTAAAIQPPKQVHQEARKPAKDHTTAVADNAHSPLSKAHSGLSIAHSGLSTAHSPLSKDQATQLLASLISDIKQTQGWTTADAAQHAGITRAAMTSILKAKALPSFPVIANILTAANLPFAHLDSALKSSK